MTRDRRPTVAIDEAMRKAVAMGFTVLSVESGGVLPFDFAFGDGDCISLARVRRLKCAGFRPEMIERSCRSGIAELRGMGITPDLFRELWVRGPARTWHRYTVLPDAVIELENWDIPDKDAGNGD